VRAVDSGARAGFGPLDIGVRQNGGGANFMVTPGKFMLAILACIAMLIVIGAMVIGPDTGHYPNIAH
jgi:hypothetical protein